MENIYKKSFADELKRQSNGGYAVYTTDDNDNVVTYKDTGKGKFFLCGWACIHFSGKDDIRLKNKLVKMGYKVGKSYYGGLNFSLNSAKHHSNGMYEIMTSAYGEVADYLRKEGFNSVRVESNLD